jgi:hypothetical protein
MFIRILVEIYDVKTYEGFDGYYICWYKKYDTSDGLIRVKYSRRIYKFKE